ncbi:MAG: DUF5666 domain-containing protein [Anaerolineae bacterium]
MMHHSLIQPRVLLLWLVALVLGVLSINMPAQAQDATATPRSSIEFTGDITDVTDTTVTVNGLVVIYTGAEIEVDLVIGQRVEIEGYFLEDGQIQATELDDPDDPNGNNPEATPEVTPEATPEVTAQPDDDDDDSDDDDTIIVIEGPVQSININIITIYNFEIEVDQSDLSLTVLQIGDVIRVEGALDNEDDDFDDRYDDDDDSDDDDDNDDNDDNRDDNDDDDGISFNRVRLVSINITFVSVTVIIVDGQVWRDSGSCAGIPDWVPTEQIQVVLVRCQPSNTGGGNTGGNPGRGGNNSDDDDDRGRDNDDDD